MTILSNDRKSQNGPPHGERSSFFPPTQTVSFPVDLFFLKAKAAFLTSFSMSSVFFLEGNWP